MPNISLQRTPGSMSDRDRRAPLGCESSGSFSHHSDFPDQMNLAKNSSRSIRCNIGLRSFLHSQEVLRHRGTCFPYAEKEHKIAAYRKGGYFASTTERRANRGRTIPRKAPVPVCSAPDCRPAGRFRLDPGAAKPITWKGWSVYVYSEVCSKP